MIISIIYLLISFILENIMSNIFPSYLSSVSPLTTIYTVVALVIIYPYFVSEKKYFLLVVIFGILFDILYTSTFIVNLVMFIIIYIIIKILNNIITNNILTSNIISIISIITYHTLTFIILNINGYNYPFRLLTNIITHSLIMTIIYTMISYCIIGKILRKKENRGIK